jgi:hypothetical protein
MDADLDLLLIAVYCMADDFLPQRPGNARRKGLSSSTAEQPVSSKPRGYCDLLIAAQPRVLILDPENTRKFPPPLARSDARTKAPRTGRRAPLRGDSEGSLAALYAASARGDGGGPEPPPSEAVGSS